MSSESLTTTVSVALPVYNAEDFLEECLESILNQKVVLSCNHNSSNLEAISATGDTDATLGHSSSTYEIEVSIYNDNSTDSSPSIIEKWYETFNSTPGFSCCLSRNESGSSKGVGYGRNETIKQSKGEYICFCDADDIMNPERISSQLKLCLEHPNSIIGSRFRRIPEGSTKNFTQWANLITQAQLSTQIYLSFGPSIVMPTWFCHRSVYDRVCGGFNEDGKGTPEDLIFFYSHLDRGGTIVRADEELVIYRYHPNATTFSVTDEVIWSIRLARFEDKVLAKWNKFSIWNAGKLGRRFFRSISKEHRERVSVFCDVDVKKISQKWYHPYPMKMKVPIVHVKDASPPFVICVKTELALAPNGDFRKLLDSLNLQEGTDYFYFNHSRNILLGNAGSARPKIILPA